MNQTNIWAHYDLLSIFKNACNCYLNILKISKNDEEVACLPIFFRKFLGFKYAFNPIQFTYTPISFSYTPKSKTQENRQTEYEILSYIAKVIYKDFLKIELKLIPDINDMRAFRHKKVNISPLYTLQIETDQNNYTYNQIKNIKKAKTFDLEINQNIYPDEFLKLLEFRMDTKGIWGDSRKNIYHHLLKLSQDQPFIKTYSVIHEHQLIAFRILITDQINEKAYDWFTASNDFAMQNGVNSLLMDYVINNLRQKQIKSFDLCGANIPSVAKFKNDFGGDLKIYFFINKKI